MDGGQKRHYTLDTDMTFIKSADCNDLFTLNIDFRIMLAILKPHDL